MKHADHFGFPILTFVDTPGAFAGKAAEEQGQVTTPSSGLGAITPSQASGTIILRTKLILQSWLGWYSCDLSVCSSSGL